jgi:hypothetical protein
MIEQHVNDPEVVMERRSIRGYLPSSLNTQPWYFCVAFSLPFECSAVFGLRRVMHAGN